MPGIWYDVYTTYLGSKSNQTFISKYQHKGIVEEENMKIIKKHGCKIEVEGREGWYTLQGTQAKKFLIKNNVDIKYFKDAEYNVVL